MPDLLTHRRGRVLTFFLLYLTEGIPLGFTATAVATEMRQRGLQPDQIGAFVGSLYLPWAWKWVIGPFVDVLSSDRLGRRRIWIVGAQILMVATLGAALPIDFQSNLGLFTALVFAHNIFAATQDVAIDALACTVLPDDERGTANGFMFAGAYLGQAIGGAGVLYLNAALGGVFDGDLAFKLSFVLVAVSVLTVTVLVAWPLREPPGPPRPPGMGLRRAAREVGTFGRDALRAFFGTRAALVGVLFAILPAGAHALSLALQSNLAVELHMDDGQIANMSLCSVVIAAVACVAGGWLSDRYGRRRMLALFLAATAIPTLYLAWRMQAAGWVLPHDPKAPAPAEAADLVAALWLASLTFSLFQGLYYGTRTALFMEVTTPAVAATQFTAYMALLNLVISYTAWWQGHAVVAWGYPITLCLDAGLGLVGIACLPFMSRQAASG